MARDVPLRGVVRPSVDSQSLRSSKRDIQSSLKDAGEITVDVATRRLQRKLEDIVPGGRMLGSIVDARRGRGGGDGGGREAVANIDSLTELAEIRNDLLEQIVDEQEDLTRQVSRSGGEGGMFGGLGLLRGGALGALAPILLGGAVGLAGGFATAQLAEETEQTTAGGDPIIRVDESKIIPDWLTTDPVWHDKDPSWWDDRPDWWEDSFSQEEGGQPFRANDPALTDTPPPGPPSGAESRRQASEIMHGDTRPPNQGASGLDPTDFGAIRPPGTENQGASGLDPTDIPGVQTGAEFRNVQGGSGASGLDPTMTGGGNTAGQNRPIQVTVNPTVEGTSERRVKEIARKEGEKAGRQAAENIRSDLEGKSTGGASTGRVGDWR